MNADYVSLITARPDAVPDAPAVHALIERLRTMGVVEGADDRLVIGPRLSALLSDPKPPIVNGRSTIDTPGGEVAVRLYDHIVGHAGTNFEPIACRACHAELPFDEMLAALGAATGDRPVTKEEMTIVCFHCGAKNHAPEHDYGISGGFSRWEMRFSVSSSRQMTPVSGVIEELSKIAGVELKLVQVLA